MARVRAGTRADRARLAVAVWLLMCAAVLGLAILADSSAGVAASTFTPVADTYVRAAKPRSNFGRQSTFTIGSTPQANAYLRFAVEIPAGEVVTRAALRLFATSRSSAGFTVHRVASKDWGELTATYANAPMIRSPVAASGAHRANRYVSVDVTRLVTGSGPVSIGVKSVSSPERFNSREAVSNRPQLVVASAPRNQQTVVFALGDGADGSATSRALANYVISQHPDRFFYLGDVYETGTATEFPSHYESLYGRLTNITDPVIGNHEYPKRSSGYYPYWMNKRGWTQEQAKHRSYIDARSGWQIVAYSSETDMTSESAWVAREVAKYGGTCRIVMAHKGRHVVADAAHDDNREQEQVWSQIKGRTAINLVGHNHIYGRLAPVDGVTVLVSGAGGHALRRLGSQHHIVVRSKTGIATATRLVLRRGAADFMQIDKNGVAYDSGTVTCRPGA